jgi:hypothetical protein
MAFIGQVGNFRSVNCTVAKLTLLIKLRPYTRKHQSSRLGFISRDSCSSSVA